MINVFTLLLYKNAAFPWTQTQLNQFWWVMFDHPPYSLDKAPSDFHFTQMEADWECSVFSATSSCRMGYKLAELPGRNVLCQGCKEACPNMTIALVQMENTCKSSNMKVYYSIYFNIFSGIDVSLMATITPPWSRYKIWCSSSNT